MGDDSSKLKQRLRFDANRLIKTYTNVVAMYDLENSLGRLIKLLSVIAFVGVNLLVFSRGGVLAQDFFLNSDLRMEEMVFGMSISAYCYGMYLGRDKDRYQFSGHSDLNNLGEDSLDISNYMTRSLYSLVAEYLISSGSTGGNGNSSPAELFKRLSKLQINKDVLSRLGASSSGSDKLTARLTADKSHWSNKKFTETLYAGFILSVEAHLPYFDERALFIAQLYDLGEDILLQVGIKISTLDAFLLWLSASEYRDYLTRKVATNSVLKPFSTVNAAMTSVYSEVLEKYTDDITFVADQLSLRKDAIDDIISGIDSEQGLVLLVGETGVGKSTLIESLALRVLAGEVPENLLDKRILELNISRILSSVEVPGELAGILQGIFTDQQKSGNIILVIDDIDQLLNLQSDLQKEIISLLAVELSSVDIKLVATITSGNYNRYFEQAPELSALFSVIEIEQATPEMTLQVLLDELPELERKHKLKVDYKSLDRLSNLAPQYDFNKFLPAKALASLVQIMQTAKSDGEQFIDTEYIDEFVEKKIGLKLGVRSGDIDSEEKKLLENLDKEIRKYVVAQNDAVEIVTRGLKRARVGFAKKNKPVAAFLFYGPTGVGKTELAKTIARVYFGDEKLLLRVDMSEYQKADNLDKLLGSKFNNEYTEGILTQFVLRHPFSVILLDELEKADPKIVDIFLQILDNANVRDGAGREIRFDNTIIVSTSNAGSNVIATEVDRGKSYKQIKPIAFEELKKNFKIEFINRFDATVMFHPLASVDAQKIAEMLLLEEKHELKDKGIEFVFSDKLTNRIVAEGFDRQFGARSLKRKITELVRDPVADALISGHLSAGDIFTLE